MILQEYMKVVLYDILVEGRVTEGTKECAELYRTLGGRRYWFVDIVAGANLDKVDKGVEVANKAALSIYTELIKRRHK